MDAQNNTLKTDIYQCFQKCNYSISIRNKTGGIPSKNEASFVTLIPTPLETQSYWN